MRGFKSHSLLFGKVLKRLKKSPCYGDRRVKPCVGSNPTLSFDGDFLFIIVLLHHSKLHFVNIFIFYITVKLSRTLIFTGIPIRHLASKHSVGDVFNFLCSVTNLPASLVQWSEFSPVTREVTGSSPVWRVVDK